VKSDSSDHHLEEMNMRRSFLILGMLVLLLAVSVPVFGQATASATLEGTVTDKAQAVIKDASVTISNKATGVSRTVKTNDTGSYRFELLAAGVYEIKVSASGFATVITEGAELLIGRTTTLDYTLNPGATSETVTVTGEAPILDAQKTDLGINLSPSDV
jgi:hypothetical protein